MALGVQLAEEHSRRIPAYADPQRSGPGRAGQAERSDLVDGQAQLAPQRPPDRLAAGAADVEMGGAAAPVADREDLVGREPTEAEEWNAHPEHDPHEHVGGAAHT